MTNAISLQLDCKPHSVNEGSTLADLVAALGHAPNAVSSAVNGQFLPRSQRQACLLKAGDAVLLFQPIVGG